MISMIGRQLVIDSSLRYALQVQDNISQTVKISVPRYYDGVDLSRKVATVIFILPDSTRVNIVLEDSNVMTDTILYALTFTATITAQAGWLGLLIQFTDDEGYCLSTKEYKPELKVGNNFTI